MWFCPVALSSVTLEHILRSEQEEICFTREKLSHVRFWPWRRFALSECSIVSYCEYLCMKINCLLMSGIVRECISLVGNNPSLLLLADKCQLVRLHAILGAIPSHRAEHPTHRRQPLVIHASTLWSRLVARRANPVFAVDDQKRFQVNWSTACPRSHLSHTQYCSWPCS